MLEQDICAIMAAMQELWEKVNIKFAFDFTLKPKQKEIINLAIQGKDIVAILPTGMSIIILLSAGVPGPCHVCVWGVEDVFQVKHELEVTFSFLQF